MKSLTGEALVLAINARRRLRITFATADGSGTTATRPMDYAETPTEKGLILQDGPGYDGDSMTGLAVSGAQLMFFSTGIRTSSSIG